MSKRVLALMSLTALILAFCCDKEREKRQVQLQEIAGESMFDLKDLKQCSNIDVICTDQQILLQEDELTVTLQWGSQFIYRQGRITDSMRARPYKQGNTVFLPVDFLEEYLQDETGGKGYSLWNGAMFFPDEICDALDHPDEPGSVNLLHSMGKPQSMGITVPNLNPERVFQPQLLQDGFAMYMEELRALGYDDCGAYAVSEYNAIIDALPLQESGYKRALQSQLADEDTEGWLVKDYKEWDKRRAEETRRAFYTEAQRANLSARGVQPDDFFWLYKAIGDEAVTAADDGLKAQITEQYNNTIAWIRSLKEAQGALEPRCA